MRDSKGPVTQDTSSVDRGAIVEVVVQHIESVPFIPIVLALDDLLISLTVGIVVGAFHFRAIPRLIIEATFIPAEDVQIIRHVHNRECAFFHSLHVRKEPREVIACGVELGQVRMGRDAAEEVAILVPDRVLPLFNEEANSVEDGVVNELGEKDHYHGTRIDVAGLGIEVFLLVNLWLGLNLEICEVFQGL